MVACNDDGVADGAEGGNMGRADPLEVVEVATDEGARVESPPGPVIAAAVVGETGDTAPGDAPRV